MPLNLNLEARRQQRVRGHSEAAKLSFKALSPRTYDGVDFGEAQGSPPQVYRRNASPLGTPSHRPLSARSPCCPAGLASEKSHRVGVGLRMRRSYPRAGMARKGWPPVKNLPVPPASC